MAKILIVEDEAKIARFLELELTHEGYEVATAADGRSGVEAALGGDFDLILLDVMLPQLNGLEVLRRVRRESSVPVIMLTARDAVMDKVSGLFATRRIRRKLKPLNDLALTAEAIGSAAASDPVIIVDAHEGRIDVLSSEGVGTRFTVCFKAAR